jgi:hypothetical protein
MKCIYFLPFNNFLFIRNPRIIQKAARINSACIAPKGLNAATTTIQIKISTPPMLKNKVFMTF